MAERTRTYFRNVDLELRSRKDLTELVEAFEPGATALSCMLFEGGHLANLELFGQSDDPETAIRRFVELIDKSPPAQALWNEARQRDFSIGVEAGTDYSHFEIALTPAVLRLASDVGARITFVVYVHGPEA